MTDEIGNLDTIASDMIGIAGAVATRDPAKALSVFDDDRDGRLSFAELRRHRWVITIAFMCLISGMLGFMIDHPDEVIRHWSALVGMLVAFLWGAFMAALHLPYSITVQVTPTEEGPTTDEEED